MTPTRTQVIVCDDAEDSARGIWGELQRLSEDAERPLEQVAWAATGSEAIREAARRIAHVVLIDMVLPAHAKKGIRVVAAPWIARQICRDFADGAIRDGHGRPRERPALLLWTGNPYQPGSANDTRAFLHLGGDGVVDKNDPYETQLEAILSARPGVRNAAFAPDGLTDRQRDVLAAADGGLSIREYAQQNYLAEKTVEGYRADIRLALGTDEGVRGAGPLVDAARERRMSWTPWYYRSEPDADDPFSMAR